MGYRVARILIGVFLPFLVLLSPASAMRSNCPSDFDYVVWASFADTPNLLSMSGYRRTPLEPSRLD